jgi:branched-chain amino acid transport system ATP-binding protein
MSNNSEPWRAANALVRNDRTPTPFDSFPFAESAYRGEAALAIRGLSVSFGGVRALSDVDIMINPADATAVVGPNGAGKTTLLNAICGVTGGATNGSIRLSGIPIAGRHPTAVARAGVGRSFQHPPLLERESVLENVMIGAHLRLGYSAVDQILRPRRVRSLEASVAGQALPLLDLIGLAHAANQPVGTLSYGARKLIDLVRATMSAPSLLLIDEPTSGLDAIEQDKVLDYLLAVRSTGRVTMLVVEHHMDFVRAFSNTVVGLKSGKVFMSGDTHEILDSDQFKSALVGRDDPGAV